MNLNYKIIVAYDDKFGIGLDNSVPWNLPNDLKRFRELTLNSNVIMGYKTFESIIKKNNKPLPKRNNIVLTRKNINSEYDNCFFFNNLEKIISEYKNAWVIGGEEIYNLFFPFVNEVYVTKIFGDFNCDRFFKIKDYLDWKITYKEDFDKYSFINYSL